VITVEKRDAERLARHLGLSVGEVERKYTRSAHGLKRVMRRKKDEHFGRICRFFDTKRRNCTIYEARPRACRAYPTKPRCGYYDFLKFEREHQQDPDYVATTDFSPWP
jgi:Fe-S-cluster containining protein